MVQAPQGIKIFQDFKKSFLKKNFSLIIRVKTSFCRILKSLDKNKEKTSPIDHNEEATTDNILTYIFRVVFFFHLFLYLHS